MRDHVQSVSSFSVATMDVHETEALHSTPDDFEEIKEPEKKTASLLIVGRAGSGKTALANSIANKEVGKEMDGLDSETIKLVQYKADRVGVDIEMWDTPGLQGNDTLDLQSFLYDLGEKERQCDIVVYCVRMDAARLEKLDIENITLITREIGMEFWSHTVIALTFANLVLFKCPPDHRENDASMNRWFQSRCKDWKNQLRSTLSEAGVPDHIITGIPFLHVGHHKPTRLSPNPWPIPCDKNWLFSFVSTVNNKLSNDAFGVLIDVLRLQEPPQQSVPNKPTAGGGIIEHFTETPRRMLVAAGIGGGVAGVVAGAVLGSVGAVAGGVVGAVVVYTSLKAVAPDENETGF